MVERDWFDIMESRVLCCGEYLT